MIEPRLGHLRVFDFDQGFKGDEIGQKAVCLDLGERKAGAERVKRPRINAKAPRARRKHTAARHMDKRAGDIFVKRSVIGCAEVDSCEGLAIPEQIVEVKIAMGEGHAPFGVVDLTIKFFHFLQDLRLGAAQACVGLFFDGFFGPNAPWAAIGRARLDAWRGEFVQPVRRAGDRRVARLGGKLPERGEQPLATGERGDCEARVGRVKERLLDREGRRRHIGPDAGQLGPFTCRGFLRLSREREAEHHICALQRATKNGVAGGHEMKRWAETEAAALEGCGGDMAQPVQSGAGLLGEKLNVTRLNHCHKVSICGSGCELNPKRSACMVGKIELERRMSETPVSEMSFEAAMAELEKVVGQLERGDVPLDDSIALYERGALLKKHCEGKLKDAEEKVAAITLDGEGNPTGTQPLDVD